MSSDAAAGISSPVVTVLMAVFNGQAHVGAAIRSILSQTFRDFELLVIDDGSTDDSAAIVGAFGDARIRLIRNPQNIGLTRSLNRGLSLARGALVARQDADDVSHATRIERQVSVLRNQPHLALLGAQARLIDDAGRGAGSSLFVRPTRPKAIAWQLMFDNAFVHSSTIFRRSVVWEQLGGYDETFRTNQDFELWSRLAENHVTSNLADILVDFRVSESSVSRGYSAEGLARVRAVMSRNLSRSLALAERHDDWLDAWISVCNPRVFQAVTGANRIPSLLNRFHRRFLELHADIVQRGVEGEEIRRQIVTMLTRASFLSISRDATASARLMAAALQVDPLGAARLAGRYGTDWIVRHSMPSTKVAANVTEKGAPS